jgi:hypothetical protein
MNKLNIVPVNQARIAIEIVDKGPDVEVNFIGDIDMQDPGEILDPLFDKIHTGCLSMGVTRVFLNFVQLTFLNSSGIKSIAKWIMKLVDLPEDKRYTITITHNKDITWQVTSLPTLTFLVPGVVKVE